MMIIATLVMVRKIFTFVSDVWIYVKFLRIRYVNEISCLFCCIHVKFFSYLSKHKCNKYDLITRFNKHMISKKCLFERSRKITTTLISYHIYLSRSHWFSPVTSKCREILKLLVTFWIFVYNCCCYL